jgi:hypothetical protein
MVLKYKADCFSPAWESCFFPYHLARSLMQFANCVEVIYLPVYIPNEQEKNDPMLYANNVRKAMSEASGIPVCDSNFKVCAHVHVEIERRWVFIDRNADCIDEHNRTRSSISNAREESSSPSDYSDPSSI